MVPFSKIDVVRNAGMILIVFFCFFFSMGNDSLAGKDDQSEFPLKSTGSLLFDADICQYLDQGETTRCEMSYSLILSQLMNTADSGSCHLDVYFVVSDTLGIAVDSQSSHQDLNPSHLTSKGDGYYIVDLFKTRLHPGIYDFKLEIMSAVHFKAGVIEKRLAVKNLSKTFSLSDPYFVSSVQKNAAGSNLDKHGITLIPNPSRLYKENNTQQNMYLYYEINNMFLDPEQPSAYSIRYTVTDLSGVEVKNPPEEQVLKKSANTSRIEVIPFEDLKTGAYRLEIFITDLKGMKIQSFSRYFWVNSKQPAEDLYLPMSKADVDKYYDQIKYIATNEEKKLFKKLDEKGLQEFLLRFWKSRDPDPSTVENEYMVAHFQKIDYVEKTFPNGLNSDMGRIYIQYGAPLEMDRQIGSIGTIKSVITWRYAISGITEFIFVDRTGDEQYVLVHSTHPDEFSNPDWLTDYNR
jgi:GWxTD domain-containing protein